MMRLDYINGESEEKPYLKIMNLSKEEYVNLLKKTTVETKNRMLLRSHAFLNFCLEIVNKLPTPLRATFNNWFDKQANKGNEGFQE